MTDVTANQGQAEAELSAADEQVLRELLLAFADPGRPAIDTIDLSGNLKNHHKTGQGRIEGERPGSWDYRSY